MPETREDLATTAQVRGGLWPRLSGAWIAEWLPLAGTVVVGSALALLLLADKSLWLDEAYSYSYARLPLPDLFDLAASRQANMSLYYLVLHFWLPVGESEFAIRLPSALFAVLSIPVIYGIGSRLYGRTVAIAAAAMMCVNAFVVRYAQEARGYSLVLFAVTLSTYLLIRALEDDRWLWWGLYAVTASLACYAHFFAGFVILAHVLTVVLNRPSRLNRTRTLVSFAIVLVVTLPLILFVTLRQGGQINWIDEPSLGDFHALLASLSGGGLALAILYLGMGVFGLVAHSSKSGRHGPIAPLRPTLLIGWFLLPIGGAFIVSLFKPIFLDKYMIVSVPAMLLLAATGFAAISQRFVRIVLAGTIGVLAVIGLTNWYGNFQKEDWRMATAYVLQRTRAGDAIVFYRGTTRRPFEYYLARRSDNAAANPPVPLYPVSDWGTLGSNPSHPPNPKVIATAAAGYERVWVVLSHARGRNADTKAAITRSFAEDFTILERRSFHRIRIALYRASNL